MRLFTAHVHAARPPLLVREGWSWGAFAFGPLWLLLHRAWIPAVLCAALWAALWAALCFVPAPVPPVAWPVAALAIAAMAGLIGWDLVRWSLERRGYVLAHVVAAPDRDAALARFLAAREDQVARLLPRPGSAGRWAWLP